MLDGLIDQGLMPDSTKEYILMMDLELSPRDSIFKKIGFAAEGSILINVVATRNSNNWHTGYDFTVKESGLESHTNYPWALALNTPENVLKIEAMKIARKKLDEAEAIFKAAWNEIETLKIKECNSNEELQERCS